MCVFDGFAQYSSEGKDRFLTYLKHSIKPHFDFQIFPGRPQHRVCLLVQLSWYRADSTDGEPWGQKHGMSIGSEWQSSVASTEQRWLDNDSRHGMKLWMVSPTWEQRLLPLEWQARGQATNFSTLEHFRNRLSTCLCQRPCTMKN